VNGYSFTAIASVAAAREVLAGKFITGVQAPVEVFGSGFLECIEGSTIKDA
jgi:hypothetical protein